MGHSHHTPAEIKVPPGVQRALLIALAPFVVATIIGLVLLWPSGAGPNLSQGRPFPKEYKASVTDSQSKDCPEVPGQENFTCSAVTVELEEGPDAGDTFTFDYSSGPRTRVIKSGDHVIVGGNEEPVEDLPEGTPPPPKYFFIDYDRQFPLLILTIVFSIVVIALSRIRGLAALAGLAISLLLLIKFVLPAILEGSDPLIVAIVGGSAIMFLALYMAHGLNSATTTAVLRHTRKPISDRPSRVVFREDLVLYGSRLRGSLVFAAEPITGEP